MLDERGLTHNELLLLEQRLLELKLAESTKAPDIGYVIPVKNPEPSIFAKALMSIKNIDPSAPIVVVDDGSESPEIVTTVAKSYGADVLRLAGSHGPGFARNLGARHLTNELLAFIDCDVELDSSGLHNLATLFELKKVVACAPRVLSAKMKVGNPASNTSFELDMGDSFGIVGPSQLPYLPSAVLLVRRDAFNVVSGFDPTLLAGEDVDLTNRLSNQGFVIYAPAVRAFHVDPQRHRTSLMKSVKYGLSYRDLRKLHPDRFSILPSKPKDRAWFILSNLVLGPTLASLLLTLTRATTVVRTLRRSDRELSTDDIRVILLISLSQSATELSELWLRTLLFPLTLLSAKSRRLRRFLVTMIVVRGVLKPRKPQESLGYRLASDMGYSLGVVTAILLELANYVSS